MGMKGATTTIYRTSPHGEEALKHLGDQGFSLPEKPDDPPSVLRDVTEMSDAGLVEEFALLTAWVDFAAAQTGLASVEERQKERALERATAEAWKSMYEDNPKTPVTVAREMVSNHKEVRQAQDALDLSHAYRRIASDLTARYERDAAVLSRELTRRTSVTPLSKARRRWEP